MQVAPGFIDRADAPTTAKFVTVAMEAGDAPLVIKSDPQMIGDIASQARATSPLRRRSTRMHLPARMRFRSTSVIPFLHCRSYGVDTLRYYYVQDNVTVTVPLVIKPEVIPEVVSATSNRADRRRGRVPEPDDKEYRVTGRGKGNRPHPPGRRQSGQSR